MTITIIAFSVITGMLLCSHHMERKQWHTERKDLYDRIQSGSIQEYKESVQQVNEYEPVRKDDEDLYFQEIEESKR